MKEKKPNLVFLMETMISTNKMEWVRIKLGFKHMFVVDSVGKSGGLALFFMTESGVEIQNYSHRHINTKVCPTPSSSL